MHSHTCNFTGPDVAGIVVPPLLFVSLAAFFLHTSQWLALLPPARPTLDPDKTVLYQKYQSVRAKEPSEIVLIGDSACLTGVDALQLSEQLPGRPSVINLGLIIGIDLEVYGELVADFAAHHKDQVKMVVVMVTPQKLKDQDSSPHHHAMWRSFANPRAESTREPDSRIARLLGLELCRERLLGYVLEIPLKGKGANFYGFPSRLQDYMADHRGSLIDLGRYQRPANAPRGQYFLAPSVEQKSKQLRAGIPRGIRFVAGIMPVPESHVAPDFEIRQEELLKEWNVWLGADHLLTRLPARMPDGLFATGAHLNGRGQNRFTELLAKELGGILRDKPNPPMRTN